MIPILYKPCEVPLEIQFIALVNMTDLRTVEFAWPRIQYAVKARRRISSEEIAGLDAVQLPSLPSLPDDSTSVSNRSTLPVRPSTDSASKTLEESRRVVQSGPQSEGKPVQLPPLRPVGQDVVNPNMSVDLESSIIKDISESSEYWPDARITGSQSSSTNSGLVHPSYGASSGQLMTQSENTSRSTKQPSSQSTASLSNSNNELDDIKVASSSSSSSGLVGAMENLNLTESGGRPISGRAPSELSLDSIRLASISTGEYMVNDSEPEDYQVSKCYSDVHIGK